MGKLINLLWAKSNPFKQLAAHMIDAGCCTEIFLRASGSSAIVSYLADQWNTDAETAIRFTAYLVALHDIGKATPQFQMQDEGQLRRLRNTEFAAILPIVKPNYVRHEHMSRRIVSRIWKQQGENRKLVDSYSCILSLHHQKIDESRGLKQRTDEEWMKLQDELERMIREIFHFAGNLPAPKMIDSVCMLLTGIVILCDWVASSEPFCIIPEVTDGYYTRSLAVAQECMRKYGLISSGSIQKAESFRSLWPQIKDPRDIQKKCENLDPLAPLTIIEAPMGEGKTEAALYMAVRCAQATGKRGIYVALPTQATSNQMYERVSNMLKTIQGGYARLLHGTAFLMNDGPEEVQSEDRSEAEKWLGSARMGLLDENGVGTVDQAMGAVLLARFSVLRLLGLANKALIIDELHAYDAYMSEIIESLICWCRALSIPVILLSATLQDSQRLKYLSCCLHQGTPLQLKNSYPLITQAVNEETVIQVEASATLQTDYGIETVRLGDDEEIASFASKKIQNGGCYCILANTVRRAQHIYQALQQIAEPDTLLMIFHARYTMAGRKTIESECLRRFGKGDHSERPAKAILVATQVVEQSLDIDFDGMLSDLAPIDMLLQRAGRVHRHRTRVRPAGLEKPLLSVIVPEQKDNKDLSNRYGASGYVYAPFLLYNTEKLLENKKSISVPQDVRTVIAQVYECVSEENLKAWTEMSFSHQLMEANADKVAYPKPEPDYFFPAQSHPEFENISIDDGFDPVLRAATRLGDSTFRIAFVNEHLLNVAQKGSLSKEQQKEILMSSVSLRLTRDIKEALNSGILYQIEKGALSGCYITDQTGIINIGERRLINDPVLGIYWEEKQL